MECDFLKDDVIRQFIALLKRNGLYTEYVFNLVQNKETRFEDIKKNGFTNFKDLMAKRRKRQYPYDYEKYGALFFTLAAFNWSSPNVGVKRGHELKKKWASVVIKWALYCVNNGISICGNYALTNLLRYYSGKDWLQWNMFTEEEQKIIDDLI